MGIIRAATGAIGGSLGDQWLEFIKAEDMSSGTVMTKGVFARRDDKRSQNKKGSRDVISNGSVIMVEPNQVMLLTDGGKIVDYSAEPGYYTVDYASAPSLFSGGFDKMIEETFNRMRFGGITPQMQKVYYINTQEISGIPFGTVNPINYFDEFYNAELYLRCHGYFSIRVVDPLKFFAEAIPRNAEHVRTQDLNKLYLSEFLTALQTAISKMSVDGIRISHVTSKGTELAQYLSTILDEDWKSRRGMIIESVGITNISYDESSKKLIDMRNQGAMLSDPTIREGYIQGSVARGMEAAGSNKGGAVSGFMGMGMAGNTGGGFMAGASASNQAQMERQRQQKEEQSLWQCSCGAKNSGKFCAECGKSQPSDGWTCSGCGAKNTGKFCGECGQKAPLDKCPSCGHDLKSTAKFCPECGQKL